MDGLGWEVARRSRGFDFLSGTRTSLDTVLGFSSSAIPTILTGKQAAEHGIWNLFYRDPEKTDFPFFRILSWLPRFLAESKILRKLLLHANKRYTAFKGYYQVYEFPARLLPQIRISESGNIYMPGGVGGSLSIFDQWQAAGRNYLAYSYKEFTDKEILERVRNDIREKDPEYCFLYLSEFDAFGHKYAGDMQAMVDKADTYAGKLQVLLEDLENEYEEVSLQVFSDHGMLACQGETDIAGALDKAGYSADSHFYILDSTMARFYLDTENDEHIIRQALKGLPGRYLTESDLKTYGIDFQGKYGDLIFLVEPGIQIVPSHMSTRALPGMHGYDPSHPMMKASFLSNRFVANPPGGIWDLHALMSETLIPEGAHHA